ncbi:MAG: helix-turn-helix domain-containing protein [Anaerolineae bacterium]|nr:helix-turn-helix domain-containing protein [Anaerolineae bacterium]
MTMIYATTFGEMLRRLRVMADLTQLELGQVTGYSAALISRLESNERCPDMDMLQQRFLPALQLAPDSTLALRLIELAHAQRVAQAMPAPPAPPAPTHRDLSTALLLILALKALQQEQVA